MLLIGNPTSTMVGMVLVDGTEKATIILLTGESQMKQLVISTLCAIVCLTALLAEADAKRGQWRPLMDGKSLQGWHAVGDGTWAMEDGVVIGRANSEKLYGLLVSDDVFRDFSVKYQFKCVIGDSGFYIRTYILPPEKAHGLQVQVGKAKSGTGGIYESYKRAWVARPSDEEQLKFVKDDDWNDMRIDAQGGTIRVYVNGVKTADIKNDASRPAGHLALQMHSGNVMDVRFKNIEIKESPDTSADLKVVKAGPGGAALLSAADAKAVGPKIKYLPQCKALGEWTEKDYAEWKLDVPKDGLYDVFVEWSLDDKQAGNQYAFEIGGTFLNVKTTGTGGWETFKTAKIGQMRLKAGVQTAVLTPIGRFKTALLNLRGVNLVPAK